MTYPKEHPKVLLEKAIKWFGSNSVKLTDFIRNFTEYRLADKVQDVIDGKVTLKQAIKNIYRQHPQKLKVPAHFLNF